MNKQIHVNSEIGDKLKNELLKIIESEGIKVIKSYEYSFQKNASFNYSINGQGEWIEKNIILPKFTDDNDLMQSMIIAHELGHYYVYDKAGKWQRKFLSDANIYSKYYNEQKAWNEAEELLKELGYWEDEVVRGVFYNKKRSSLISYKPRGSWTSHVFHSISRPIILTVKLLIYSYFIWALLVNFGLNGVPIPFMPGDPAYYRMSRLDFFGGVQTLFWFLLLGYIIKKLLFRSYQKK